jgi:outer membrane protein assembly factor BamE (lipoprotein component of BamABCDE complex)
MNPCSFIKRIILVCSLASVLLSGCAFGEKTTDQISEQYKQDHDYESLVALIPQLDLVMSRSEVENLLGEPMVCPFTGQCYYISDETIIVHCEDESRVSHETCQSFPLILVVNYSLVEQNISSPQDRLAGIYFGPVGE